MSSVRFSVSLHHSSWPCFMGMSMLGLVLSLLVVLKCGLSSLILPGLIGWGVLVLYMSAEMVWEAMSGEYSFQTLDNLKFSLCLFVWSEVMFFFSFLWSYFHYALSPSIWGGSTWPFMGITTINPMGVPLFSTILLVSSGVTITWSHHLVMSGSQKESFWALSLTVLLGILFLVNQLIEFTQASFTISDSVLGSVFFTLTGFHGFHVMVGALLLFMSSLRLYSYHFSSLGHTMYELSIWYWHLVDCVWLLVYSVIYWWGS